MDSTSLNNPENPCNKSGDAQKVNNNCSNPPEDDYSDNCCEARKCMLVPFNPNKCCPKEEGKKQKTPHHIVPKSQFYESGFAGKSSKGAQDAGALLQDASKENKYSPNKAPCICEEGTSHSSGDHGLIHTKTNNLTVNHSALSSDDLSATGKSIKAHARWEVSDAESVGAQATSEVTGCDKDCLQAQVRKGHADMGINADDKIRPITAGRVTEPAKIITEPKFT
jgi:hypothetical protein